MTLIVEVLLATPESFRDTVCGNVEGATYTDPVLAFTVDATDPMPVLDTVYAICNSYPDEMHCSEKYRDLVEAYRAGENRSLSVGDVIQIRGLSVSRAWYVASFGWNEVR